MALVTMKSLLEQARNNHRGVGDIIEKEKNKNSIYEYYI